MDDFKLIESYKSWDKDAFWLIYDKYINTIYNFIYYKTYDREIAQDITSDTFLKALKAVKKVDIDREDTNIKAWLFKIAYNNVVDYYRKKKDDLWLDDIMENWIYNDVSQDIDNKEKLKEVLEYLKDIKKDQQEILIMRIWDNLSYEEISKITWKSKDNCKKIVSRTLVKINSNVSLLLLILLTNNIF